MKSKKTEEFEKAVNRLLSNKRIKDAEMTDMDEDEVIFWTIQKMSDKRNCIVCHYLTWEEDVEEWTEEEVSEIEGPALLTCPIRFFSKARSSEWMFPEWRYEIKKYHEQMGDMVQNEEVTHRLIRALEK